VETADTLAAVAAHPAAQTLFVWTGALAMLTLVPAFLAAARLARRRRPLLATWAAGVNLAAYLGAGLGFASLDLATDVARHRPARHHPRLGEHRAGRFPSRYTSSRS
jgi:hypothetical protein